MPRPFNPLPILILATLTIVGACAAYAVDVGDIWGVVLQVVGVRHRPPPKEVMVDEGEQLSVAGASATLERLPQKEVDRRLSWALSRQKHVAVNWMWVKDGWI